MSQPRVNRRSSAAAPIQRKLLLLCGLLVLLAAVLVYDFLRPHGPAGGGLNGNNDEATAALALALRKTPAAGRLAMLVRDTQDGGPGLRYAAVDALGSEKGSQAAAAIIAAFQDSSSAVRERALQVLPGVDARAGLKLLISALKDEDAVIRSDAASEIVSRADHGQAALYRPAVPALVLVLSEGDWQEATLAMAALRSITGRPWFAGLKATDAHRQAAMRSWQTWWKQAGEAWHVPASLADAPPIRPTRMDPAPDFRLADVDGRSLSLASQKGRITLLNFWGTWCPPCKQEIPDLIRISQVYGPRGVDVIGMALSEPQGAEEVRQWCAQHGVSYRQALATPDMQTAYGDIEGVPVTVLIDGQGRIRRRWEGPRDFGTFAAAIDSVLSSP